MRALRLLSLALPLLLLAAACGGGEPEATAVSTTPAASPTTTTTSPTSAPPSTTTTTRKPSPRTTTRKPTPTTPAPRPDPGPPSLKGDTRNAWAFAPLDDPGQLTLEGSVSSYKAWSTSKVLVVAAFLDTVAGGNPARVSASNKALITRALTASDGDAVVAIRSQIPGSAGRAIDSVLRSIGDRTTFAPDISQGGMQWTVREQVRFMTALAAGKVVSPAASSYLLGVMHPIAAHRWGLGTIGASAFKGGWLESYTVTRQMGIVNGYAVAIITDAVGPAVIQTDGDSAHVEQMNRLAALLKKRLAEER